MTDCASAPSLSREQILLLLAHHEAGHAVVALHHELQVASLELFEYDNGGRWSADGITYVTYLPSLATQFAVQAAAGQIASLKWLEQQGLLNEETLAAANADHDRDETIELLAQDQIIASWPDTCDLAADLVSALWWKIAAVAEAAAKNGYLTGQQIAALADGAAEGARGFRKHHGSPETWSTTDFETYEHLAEIDQFAGAAHAYQPAA